MRSENEPDRAERSYEIRKMPHWLKRFLFLLVVGVAAWIEGLYLGPLGFSWVALALVITVVLAIGWMRTYWNG
jgi:hypothetical protein